MKTIIITVAVLSMSLLSGLGPKPIVDSRPSKPPQRVHEAKVALHTDPVPTKQQERSTTATQPVPTGGCEQYRSLIAQYDWNVDIAMQIMFAESSCNPNATGGPNTNGTYDHGLFQLNQIKVHDPAENIRIAYEVKYLGAIKAGKSGWAPWAVCKTKVQCY